MITLLDYGAGNVRSVINAVEHLGETVHIARTPEAIAAAEKIIFPGVGAFGTMMKHLEEKQFVQPLKAFIASGRPYLGICLGFHALFASSDEAPGLSGLGIFPGTVKRFDDGLAVPHIGWNGVRVMKPSPLFRGFSGDEKFYFVHSYHVQPEQAGLELTATDYGRAFTSSVMEGNVIGTQFHPEKSGQNGIRILQNFLDMSANDSSGDNAGEMPEKRSSQTQLAKRIIACLDVRANDQGDLVVTKGDQYDVRERGEVRNLGKPVELARRYYEEGADEITFLNITGFRDFPLEDMPMLEVLKETSRNVFVPLTIGGGIREYTDVNGKYHSALDVASEYFRSGADKISIGSDAVLIAEEYRKTGQKTGTSAIEQIAAVYGSQAVVISIDPRRVYVGSPDDAPHHLIETAIPGPKGERYCWFQCTIRGGREGREIDAVSLANICEILGAGEILLNAIDRDGTSSGFDIELISAVKNAVSVPVIASSGAGCPEHFEAVFKQTEAESALAAGIFHRREVPISAVKAHLTDAAMPVRI